MESPQKFNEIYHFFILSLWNHAFYNTSQLGPATFPVPSSHTWLVATLLDSVASRFPRKTSSLNSDDLLWFLNAHWFQTWILKDICAFTICQVSLLSGLLFYWMGWCSTVKTHSDSQMRAWVPPSQAILLGQSLQRPPGHYSWILQDLIRGKQQVSCTFSLPGTGEPPVSKLNIVSSLGTGDCL